MVDYTTPIAESNNSIVLDKYTREWKVTESHQSEAELERQLIEDLVNQNYEYLSYINNPQAMLMTVRGPLQILNKVEFFEGEWKRFVEISLNTKVAV